MNTLTRTKKSAIDTGELLSELNTSDSMREAISTSESYGQALGAAALDYARDEVDYKTNELNLRGHALNVIARTESYVKSLTALKSGKDLHRSDRQVLKEDLVEFNHTIRRMIEANPELTIPDVKSLVIDAYRDLKSNGDLDGVMDEQSLSEEVKACLQGMRHEIAAAQLIEYSGYYVYTDISIEDDLRGIDMYVLVENDEDPAKQKWLPIDIKSTKRKADETNQDPRNNAIYSLLEDGDFGNSFEMHPENMRKKAAAMKKQIEDSYLNHNHLAISGV